MSRLQGTTATCSSSGEEKVAKTEHLRHTKTRSRNTQQNESISASKDSVTSSTSGGSKKRTQEKMKVVSGRVRRNLPRPSATRADGTSTSSESAYGLKPVKTDKVSKTNFGGTMQEKKSYAKKLREQA